MSKKCKAYSASRLGLEPPDNRKAFYAGWAAALAEPVQEPYAWMAVGGSIWRHKTSEDDVPLYTAPPQRKPLPASEIVTMYDESPRCDSDMIDFARAIEKAHGIGGDA